MILLVNSFGYSGTSRGGRGESTTIAITADRSHVRSPPTDLSHQFIATNLDAVTHLTAVQEWAGNNAMVGAIKGCTGQEPTLVGKPSPLMIDYLEFKYGIDKVSYGLGARG